MAKSPKEQRRRGRRGGRPLKHPRTVPPPEEALPAKLTGGVAGTAKVPVTFPCDAARWTLFCEVYGDNAGKLKPAADAAGLARQTVTDWFQWAANGQEPYRSEIVKALTALGIRNQRAGRTLVERNPLEWLHRAYPEDYPREASRLDVTSGGAAIGLVESVRRAEAERREKERGEGERGGEPAEDV